MAQRSSGWHTQGMMFPNFLLLRLEFAISPRVPPFHFAFFVRVTIDFFSAQTSTSFSTQNHTFVAFGTPRQHLLCAPQFPLQVLPAL